MGKGEGTGGETAPSRCPDTPGDATRARYRPVLKTLRLIWFRKKIRKLTRKGGSRSPAAFGARSLKRAEKEKDSVRSRTAAPGRFSHCGAIFRGSILVSLRLFIPPPPPHLV